jgi:hypothetical protein
MSNDRHLDIEPNGKDVDKNIYGPMTLFVYHCASRPDIMLSVGTYAIF